MELVNLLKDGETLADLMKMSPEEILLRWVNHQLEKVSVAVDHTSVKSSFICLGWISEKDQELPRRY